MFLQKVGIHVDLDVSEKGIIGVDLDVSKKVAIDVYVDIFLVIYPKGSYRCRFRCFSKSISWWDVNSDISPKGRFNIDVYLDVYKKR